MSAAFATAAALAPRSHFLTGQQQTSLRPSSSTFRVAPQMALQTTEKSSTESKKKSSFSRLEANRSAKAGAEYRGPQGFTPYAEKVNGRMAQMGFVIGLITEIVSGKPIGQQMLIMFSPLTHALQALGGVIGK